MIPSLDTLCTLYLGTTFRDTKMRIPDASPKAQDKENPYVYVVCWFRQSCLWGCVSWNRACLEAAQQHGMHHGTTEWPTHRLCSWPLF